MKRCLLFVLLLCLPTLALAQEKSTQEKLHAIYFLQDQRSLGDGRLLQYLRDPKPDVAFRAAIAFGNIQDTSRVIITQLGAVLLDAKPNVARAAAFSLGQLGPGNSAEQALLAGLEKRKELRVRSELLEALGKVGGESSLSVLAADSLAINEPIVSGGAALGVARFALRKVRNPEGTAFVARLSQGRYPLVRTSAAYALWRIGDPELLGPYTDIMIKLAADTFPDTRMFAVNALGRLKESDKVLGSLLESLNNDTDWRVRVNALRALGGFSLQNRTDICGAIMTAFEDRNEHVSLTALQTIGVSDLKEKKGTGLWNECELRLTAIVSNRNQAFTWRQRGEAAITLAKFGGESELRFLSGVLAGENKPGRASGQKNADASAGKRNPELSADERNTGLAAKLVAAIGEIPGPEAANALLAIQNENNAVVMECANAMVKSCRDTTVSAALKDRMYQQILSFLGRNDMAVTTTAAAALADSALLRESSVAPLVSALSRLKTPDDVEAIVEIVKTLGAFKNQNAVPALERTLASKDRTVVSAAADAMKNITGKDYSSRIPQNSTPAYTDYDWTYFDSLAKNKKILIRTTKGDFKVWLYPDEAPFTVMSMMKLIDKGFFNGLTFHRVVPNFVIQGGDPRGDGWGGPGYAIRSEFSLLKYGRGAVGVASSGKDTEGCQFFVTHCPTPHLDGRYTIFGEIVDGMDVVNAIQVGDVIKSISRVEK